MSDSLYHINEYSELKKKKVSKCTHLAMYVSHAF